MSTQLIIILVYIAVTVIIGVWSMKKMTGSDAFHGAGLGVIACVAAGTGEWLGGTSTIGVAQYGFTSGLSGSWYTIANGIGVMFLALFFARRYRSMNQITVPGLIETFIGGKGPRVVAAVILTFVMIVVGAAQIIAAGSLGVTVLGIPFTLSCIVLGIAFIVYTLAGGMRAVASTNILHLIAMYGGVIIALFLLRSDLGGSFTPLYTSLPAFPYWSWFGIGVPKVASWIIASVLGACTAQAGIQPLLAAKDIPTARTSAIITACIVAPFGIFTCLLGMAAKVKYPAIAAKLAMPTMLMHMEPIAGGIVLASILAAVLSTISPIILAAGTMVTKDIYQRVFRPNATDKQVFLFSRVMTAIAGVLTIVIAMLPNIKILDLVYFAYTLRGSIFVIILFAIYWKSTSRQGCVWGMIATAIAGFGWVLYNAKFGHFPIHPEFNETYAALIVATVATPLLSLVFKKTDAENKFKADILKS